MRGNICASVIICDYTTYIPHIYYSPFCACTTYVPHIYDYATYIPHIYYSPFCACTTYVPHTYDYTTYTPRTYDYNTYIWLCHICIPHQPELLVATPPRIPFHLKYVVSKSVSFIGLFFKRDLRNEIGSTEIDSPYAIPHIHSTREVGGWGRVPFSRNLMKPTPRRKWYLTTGRRAH